MSVKLTIQTFWTGCELPKEAVRLVIEVDGAQKISLSPDQVEELLEKLPRRRREVAEIVRLLNGEGL